MGNSAQKRLDAIDFNADRVRRDKERSELASLPDAKLSAREARRMRAYMAITAGMEGWNSP